jgi:hypothetical protein
MCEVRRFLVTGCLVAYGPSYSDLARRAAVDVDQILKGAKPPNLGVEQRPSTNWSSTSRLPQDRQGPPAGDPAIAATAGMAVALQVAKKWTNLLSACCRYVRATTDKCGTTIDVRCYGAGVLRPSLLLEALTIGRLRHCLWMARGQYRRGGAWPRRV